MESALVPEPGNRCSGLQGVRSTHFRHEHTDTAKLCGNTSRWWPHPRVRTSPEVGPGATVGTPGLGYSLMLCLGKSLVVILNYALTAGPLWSRALLSRQTAPDPLPTWGGSGDATCPGGGSPQPKTARGPGPPPGPGPHILSGPLSRVEPTPRRGQVRSRHVSAGAGTRGGARGFYWKTRLPTAFNAVGGAEPDAVFARLHCWSRITKAHSAVAGAAHAAYVRLLCQLDTTARLRSL